MIQIVLNHNGELLVYLVCPQCEDKEQARHLVLTVPVEQREEGEPDLNLGLYSGMTFSCPVCKQIRRLEVL